MGRRWLNLGNKITTHFATGLCKMKPRSTIHDDFVRLLLGENSGWFYVTETKEIKGADVKKKEIRGIMVKLTNK